MRKTCLNEIYKLAKDDDRIVFIGSDIGTGTLEDFKNEIPDRFFMEGVSEAHLVSMMAGLAMSGKIPYLNTIATFLTRRPFEQVLLDGGLHETKIRLVGSGGGVVYAPLGPTHFALEDIGIMRTIPGMTIVACCDAEEMKRLMPLTPDVEGPMYIRMAKGGDEVVSRPELGFEIGKGILMAEGEEILIISTGITTQVALKAREELVKQGRDASIIHMHTIKPLDADILKEQIAKASIVIAIEEHQVIGGLGSAVSEVIAENVWAEPKRFARIGFPDCFPHNYGSQALLMEHYGISVQGILQKVEDLSGAYESTNRIQDIEV